MHRLLFIMVITALFTGCISEGPSQAAPELTSKTTPPQASQEIDLDSKLLEIAAKEPQVSIFTAANPQYSFEVTTLNPENITLLAEKYPVIYGDLPEKTLYQIEYKNGRGMLVIVDKEGEDVLRHFRVTGVKL